jgi:hypothetical protein
MVVGRNTPSLTSRLVVKEATVDDELAIATTGMLTASATIATRTQCV